MARADTQHDDSVSPVGILAVFDRPESLKAAAAGLREAGYARFEAYSPYPVHGLYEAMGRKRTSLPRLVLLDCGHQRKEVVQTMTGHERGTLEVVGR